MQFSDIHSTNLNPQVSQLPLDKHNMAVAVPSEGSHNTAEGNNMSMDRNRNMGAEFGADMGAVDSKVASTSISEGAITASSPSTGGRQQP